ncbi:hypothetical protein [Streptomyces sp. NPDC005784]|uniref:hypothetical protein n=1 Tax=Streptomyces sp. NPDC005784 TaxID=3364731 RepID=UPI00368408B0
MTSPRAEPGGSPGHDRAGAPGPGAAVRRNLPPTWRTMRAAVTPEGATAANRGISQLSVR